jgi:SAM-dependent methyltransferase
VSGNDGPEAGRYAVPVPESARPMGRMELCRRVLAGSGREIWARARGRPVRTPDTSAAEYEQRWRGQRSQAQWSRVTDPVEATRLSSYGDTVLGAMMEFRPYRVAAPAYFGWRARKIAAVVGAHTTFSDRVVEVGCGLGKNLLALAAHGYRRLAGLDVSPSAVAAVADQFRHFALPVLVAVADARRLAADRGLLAGSTVLTVYALEQLPRHGEQALTEILRARPRQVLQVEPCPDRLPGRRAWERIPSRLHCWARDYQTALLPALRRMQDAGLLRVTEVTPLGFSPYLFHGPTLIRWVPGG